jgi:hypothetical protein
MATEWRSVQLAGCWRECFNGTGVLESIDRRALPLLAICAYERPDTPHCSSSRPVLLLYTYFFYSTSALVQLQVDDRSPSSRGNMNRHIYTAIGTNTSWVAIIFFIWWVAVAGAAPLPTTDQRPAATSAKWGIRDRPSCARVPKGKKWKQINPY